MFWSYYIHQTIDSHMQDSFTFGGRSDGGPLPAAVLTGTNPSAAGRATDGPVWAEDLASDLGATIKDYAVRFLSIMWSHTHFDQGIRRSGRCDPLAEQSRRIGLPAPRYALRLGQWSRLATHKISIAALFLSQNNNLDPTTTLYTVFFGIK